MDVLTYEQLRNLIELASRLGCAGLLLIAIWIMWPPK